MVVYSATMNTRGIIMIVAAMLHVLHLHCEKIFTKNTIIAVMLLFCIGSTIRGYTLPNWGDQSNLLYICGSFIFITGVVIVISLVAYHLVQECRGRVNCKNVIGYEMVFIISTILGFIGSTISKSDYLDHSVIETIVFITLV